MKPNLSPPAPIGETPARTATPGAATSGFRRSESVASSGPREENPAICGCASAGSPVVSLLTRETLMAGFAVTLALMASVAGGFTWTVGTACLSASSEEWRQVDQDHADAAAARDLGALGDAVIRRRGHRPRPCRRSWPDPAMPGPHRAGLARPAAAALAASTTPASATSRFMMLAPRNLLPSENSTVPCSSWEKLLAATVVTHGCAVVDGAGGRAGVAGGGGHEDAGRGGGQERHGHRVGGGGRGARDGVVQDVHAVQMAWLMASTDGRGVAAAGVGIGVFPADLVDGELGGRRDAAGQAEAAAVDEGFHVGVAGGGAGRVGSVASDVDRGNQLFAAPGPPADTVSSKSSAK